MSKRVDIKTPRSVVFDYWKDKAIMPDGSVVSARNMPDGARLVVDDWGEPCCWGCGRGFPDVYNMQVYDRLIVSDKIEDIAAIWDLSKVDLERCHILADAVGGEDKPENLFLLCHRCHCKSPDTTDPRYFFRWVYKQGDGLFYKALEEAFMDECRCLHKNPFSLSSDGSMLRLVSHWGIGISESSFVAGLVDVCQDLPDGVDFDEFVRAYEC